MNGAQGRIRTTDTRIFNPLLYQLSYLGDGYRNGVATAVYKRGGAVCPEGYWWPFLAMMVGLARQYFLNAVELFSQHGADKHVRPSRLAERKDEVCGLAGSVWEAISTTD